MALLLPVFAACDNPEAYMVHTGTFASVFDVKDGKIHPALSKDAYRVNNLSEMGVKNGDRAYMLVDYVYDVYAMPAPDMDIKEVYAKVATRNVSKREDIDKREYNSLLLGPAPVYLHTMDGQVTDETSEFIWTDGVTQCVSVRYPKGYAGNFEMALDSIHGNALCFRLYSKLWSVDGEVIDPNAFPYEYNPAQMCKILSFDMNLKDVLTAEEKEKIREFEYLTTGVSYVYESGDIKGYKEVDGLYVPKGVAYTLDVFKNPLYDPE